MSMPSRHTKLDQIATCLINGDQCYDRVKDLAVEITHGERDEPVSVFWIANGALFFAADLIREMVFREINVNVAVVRGRSYSGTVSGNLKHDIDLIDLEQHRGRRVYVLDDCLDTGNTLYNVCRALQLLLPGSRILPVAFVVKMGCQTYDVALHAHGFEIHENPWLLGYGLDENGKHRGEPGIWAKERDGWPRRAEDVPVYVGGQPLKLWSEERRKKKKSG
jgi:hypoxanthine phosphoribosyltransferase